MEGDEVKSVESRPAEEGLPPSHVASVIIRDDAGLSLRRLRESRGRVGESEWIEVCRDKLREVFRIHGRWAAKLPARLFGIRREAMTDTTAVR